MGAVKQMLVDVRSTVTNVSTSYVYNVQPKNGFPNFSLVGPQLEKFVAERIQALLLPLLHQKISH
jgi:hypothetical protein